jgi:3-isopropylmalate dehydrogenase
MIGSMAMMLEYSFDMVDESRNVWDAMQAVFGDGFSTADLSNEDSGAKMISTEAFGDKVVEHLQVS